MGNLILFNKPYNFSSNETVQIVKIFTNSKKAGHSGTLDPLATGLLIIATDEKTKKLNSILCFNKEYLVEIKFGEHRDTFDKEGKILIKNCSFPNKEDILDAIDFFKKTSYMQQVPIYSSVKINGKKLYEYARKNELIDCPFKEVFVNSIDLVSYDDTNHMVELKMNVSKGFYIRSFAVDFASKLNSCAYVFNLKRTKIADYDLKDALVDFQQLWRFHLKVKIIDINLEINEVVENLLIGQFDIIHLEQKEMFQKDNLSAMIFINNPSKNKYFNSTLMRILNLCNLGVKRVFVYDIANNNLSADKFNKLILKKINPKNIIVGEDFKYGKDLKDIQNLKRDFQVSKISNHKISSTNIRNLIEKGLIKEANKLSLNFLKLRGVVIHGNKKGRLLNFPTINIEWETNIEIKPGSYASLMKMGNKLFESTTFFWPLKNEKVLTETFIHEFKSNIYGKIVEVWPIEFIESFSVTKNKEALVEKIQSEVFKSKNFHLKNKINSVDDYLKFLEK